MNPETTTHILRLGDGRAIQLTRGEANCSITVRWIGFGQKRISRRALRRYLNFRDEVVNEWSVRTGRRALIVEL